MKYPVLLICLFVALVVRANAAKETADVVVLHPGDTLYATFTESPQGLQLVSTSSAADDHAQLILSMEPFDSKTGMLMLKVQSRIKKTMMYKAEMRWPSKQRRRETSVVPVMAGLASFETWPHPIEELALYSFELKE
jgi:hypothetical protein